MLTRVYVKEGQKVSQGQVLAESDDEWEMSQQLSQMRIRAALAEDYVRAAKDGSMEPKLGSEMQCPFEARTSCEHSKMPLHWK